METLRFVSWAAVSSLPQAKLISIDDQLATNRQHIDRHGGALVEELVVPGESRSIVLFEDAARTIAAYGRLKELIDAKAFDVLIYLDRSRLGRKASLSMAVIELCHDARIATYETENPPTEIKVGGSYDDMLLGAIKSVGAQREVQKFVERHRIGMLGRAKRGEMLGAVVYGYVARYDADGTRTIEIDEPAADAVRRLFAHYLGGDGMNVIAQKLNESGAQPPALAPMWAHGNVGHVLRNVWRYAAFVEINRYSERGRPYAKLPGAWPAIISEELANQVEAEREMRRSTRRLANTVYLLSSVVWCAICEKRMVMKTQDPNKTKPGFRVMQMCCPKNSVQHPIKATSYRRILRTLRAEMEALRFADLDAIAATPTTEEHIREQIAAQGRTIETVKAGIGRADAAFVNGLLDMERYRVQLDRLNVQMAAALAELERLERALTEEQDRGTFRHRLDEVVAHGLAMLDSADVTAANAWLRRHVRIWVAYHKVVAIEWL